MSNELLNTYIRAGQPDGDDLGLSEMAEWAAEEIERLRFGLGIFQASVTDEQRRRVARICYESHGVCFCGCHGSKTGDAGEG